MPRNANQSKQNNYSLHFTRSPLTRVHLGDALNFFIGSFSASMWIKSPDNGKEFFSRYISANGVGNFRIGCGANGATANTVSLMTKNILLSGSTDIRDGNWHHVCVTMDAISSTQYTRTIYVDGSQDAQDTVGLVTYVSTSSSYGLNLGCNFQNNGHSTVDMSEVSIFDYALSSSQVTTIYGNSTNGVGNPMALPTPPIAYYPLGTSAWNGQYLSENNAIGDYVFDFIPNNYINLNSDILFNTNQGFSFSSWVNLDSYSDPYPYLVNLKTNVTDGIAVFISNNSSYAGVNVGSTDSSITKGRTTGDISSTFLNSWNHVVVTYNGNGANTLSNYSIYVNGSSVTLTTTGNYSTMPNTANNIGRRSNSYHYLDGKLSNVQIWDTALSSTEAETLYNYGSPIRTLANIPQNSNLKAWYKLDASEVYNSTTTEWEINDSTAAELKAFAFDLKQGGNSANNELVATYPNNELNGLSSITIAGWLYANNSIAQYDGIYINRSGANYFLINVSTVASDSYSIYAQGKNGTTWIVFSSAGIKKNTWNHIALVCESSSIKFYVNGIDATSSSSNNFPGITQTSNFNIGSDGTSRNFDGLMSNFKVWNTNLSDTQVFSLYNNGKPIQTLNNIPQNSNLIGWWQLNDTATFDGTNWSIPDDSGNNNTGVSLNMAQTNLVDTNVSTLNGISSGMSQANLVQSDLQTVAPYSKYAMEFDSADSDYIEIPNSSDLQLVNTDFSISFWLNPTNSHNGMVMQNYQGGVGGWGVYYVSGNLRFISMTGPTVWQTLTTVSTSQWTHILIVGDDTGNNLLCYKNGAEVYNASYALNITSTPNNTFIGSEKGTVLFFNGKLSNFSIWNTALTSSQVSEIYNEGLPGNLNSHSAYSNLVSWWQLGENSSFDGNNWIVADEKGTNNGTSANMTEANLTNGVGTTANGVSSGMSEGNLVGDAPYSTANAISTNMIVTSRVSGSGNTP